MNGHYKGKIKVVCDDLMCFPVDPKTLEATGCTCYDLWAWSDLDPEPVETISYSSYLGRKLKLHSFFYEY